MRSGLAQVIARHRLQLENAKLRRGVESRRVYRHVSCSTRIGLVVKEADPGKLVGAAAAAAALFRLLGRVQAQWDLDNLLRVFGERIRAGRELVELGGKARGVFHQLVQRVDHVDGAGRVRAADTERRLERLLRVLAVARLAYALGRPAAAHRQTLVA